MGTDSNTPVYWPQPYRDVFHAASLKPDDSSVNWDFVRTQLRAAIARRAALEPGGKLSATQLAIRAGVSQPTISRFLKGTTETMHQDTLAALARALQCNVAQLIGEYAPESDAQVARVVRAMEHLPEYQKTLIVEMAEGMAEHARPRPKARAAKPPPTNEPRS
jgi:DNA-binding Xre family transcriptional regulator